MYDPCFKAAPSQAASGAAGTAAPPTGGGGSADRGEATEAPTGATEGDFRLEVSGGFIPVLAPVLGAGGDEGPPSYATLDPISFSSSGKVTLAGSGSGVT